MLLLDFLPSVSYLTALELAGAGFVIYYIGWIIYARHFHPYADIPGPFLASFSTFWYWRVIRYGIAEGSQLPIHKKYGSLVRIAPDEVQIADPKALEIIYGTTPPFEKTEFYDAFAPSPTRPDMFTERNPEVHFVARRMMAPLYTQAAVLSYEKSIDGLIDSFCDLMDENASNGTQFDMSNPMLWYTFDMIGKLLYGREEGFGFLRDRFDHNEWVAMFDFMKAPVSALAYLPYGLRTAYMIWQTIFSPPTRKAFRSMRIAVETSKAAVKERRELIANGRQVGSKNDFLSKYFDMVHDVDKGGRVNFNYEDVEVNVWTMLVGGSDTTGYQLTSIAYHIIKYPAVYAKLVEEIDNAFKAGTLSFPVKYNDAIKLPYLNAVIREGWRYLPAVGTGFPRYVPKGGAMISGKFFPGGYRVIMNPIVTHMDKAVFGDDAESYNPERWICDEKTYANMVRHDSTFGHGSRMCMGRQLVATEMWKLIPTIFRKYRFELMKPEMKVSATFTSKPYDVQLRVFQR